MCLAIPAKIIKIDGLTATVETGNHTHLVDLSLVKNPRIGDYIMAHENLAINKLADEDALKIIEMVKILPHKHDH